jgi:protein-tyrosine phosphatase
LDTQKIYGEKFKLFCEYCRHHKDQEVPDPYYGGHHGFDYVMELIVDGCQSLFGQACDQLKLDAK